MFSKSMKWKNVNYLDLGETLPEETIAIVSDLRNFLKNSLQNYINNSCTWLEFPNDWDHKNQNIQKRLRTYLLGNNKVEQTIFGWSLINKNTVINKIREIK